MKNGKHVNRADSTPIVPITGMAWAAAHGLDITKDSLTGEDFANAGLPMVVACTSCEMTMVLLSPTVRINPKTTNVYCKSCWGD